MSNNRPALHPHARWPDRFGVHDHSIGLPSWVVSVTLHAGLLFAFAMSLKSCSSGIPSASDGEFRDVGIYVKSNSDAPDKQEALSENDISNDEAMPLRDGGPSIDSAIDSDAPFESLLDQPKRPEEPVIGPGGLSAAPLPTAEITSGVVTSGTSARSAAALASGNGETSFFDIRDHGQTFVYVIDNSGSMTERHAILWAKAELKASLQSLDAHQQFHVIFYNDKVREMTLRPGKPTLNVATDINRTLARQFIDGIQPDGGTTHIPPLKRALQYAPDVIFFLTDGNEPAPETVELNELMAINKGRSRIHCVEFGEGPQLSIDNFIKKLARQNGGTYRYRDVSAIDSRQSGRR